MKNMTMGMAEAWRVCFLAVLGGVLILIPDMAFASQPDNAIANAVCDISDTFTGEVATGLGTIAICTIGVMACLGRVQWTAAIIVAVGISILFGATALVSTLAVSANSSYVGCG